MPTFTRGRPRQQGDTGWSPRGKQIPPCETARVKTAKGKAMEALEDLEKTMPEVKEVPGVETVDHHQAFLLYCSFCGDMEKTAHALGITPAEVNAIALAEDWNKKLEPILKLQRSKRPGDVERGISRAMNFVQAHRMRLFLDRIIKKLSAMNDKELVEYCFQTVDKTDKDGNVISSERKMITRPFADLASALEKCHMLAYYALTDSVSERAKRGDTEAAGPSNQEIHSAIAEAMANVGNSEESKKLIPESDAASAAADLVK